MNQATALPGLRFVKLALISLSALNPRKRIDPQAQAELVESVCEKGVLQPLRLRPKGDGFEVVCGERRYRAACDAALEEVPATIAEMDDEQALEEALVENGQRADIHPLEEADAYQRLHQEFGRPLEDIADKIGKPRSHVAQRLRLAQLAPKAREAFAAGEFGIGVALLVARVPVPALQEQAIEDFLSVRRSEDETIAVADARWHIEEKYMLRLEVAPFDRGDADLVPAAGPCTTCPKRTGNQPELFADVQAKDTCTDPICFKAKKEASWDRTRLEAEAKGRRVLPDDEAKKVLPHGYLASNAPYIRLDDTCSSDPKYRSWRVAIGKKNLPPLVIARAEDGRVYELVDKKDALAALKVAHPELGKKATAASAANPDIARERERQKNLRVVRQGQIKAVVDEAKNSAGDGFFRLIVAGVLEGSWHDVVAEVMKRRGLEQPKKRGEDVLRELLPKLAGADLRGLVVELMVTRGAYFAHSTGVPEPLASALKYFDLDAKAIEKQVLAGLQGKQQPLPQKKPAAKKPAAKPAKRR